jgi:muramoyltetrapeptide carboxypeptidase
MTKIPPYLQKGDTIGICCPSGYMPQEKAQTCIDTLEEWGYHVKKGKTLESNSPNYFSGKDKERLEDIQDLLNDTEIKAVLCARGGYGIGRIIEQISFKEFKKKPKWIIGFSDVTILHSHIYSNFHIASMHAPMAAAFSPGDSGNEFIQSFRNLLEGGKAKYQCEAHPLNRKGEAVGELIGGNLTLLAHMTGTSSESRTRGKILLLEDVGEYLYNTDRMLYQLKRNGRLSKLAGLIIGGFTQNKDTDRPFGKSVYEIIHDIVKEFDYPVCFGFPVGHEKENYALKLGLGHKLKIGKSRISLEE